jgi:hypothetical protein
MLSGVFDKKPLVRAGSTPLQPTSATQFKAHHGQRGGLQAYLANLGSKIDRAKGQTTERPPQRWQQHNCHPWRNDNCVACPNEGLNSRHPATISQPLVVRLQAQRHIPHPSSPTNTTSRQISTLHVDSGFYENGDIYDSSFVRRPKAQRAPDSGVAFIPVNDVEKVEQRLKNDLFIPFLDKRDVMTEKEHREQVLSVLEQHLQTPIILAVPSRDIASCEEYTRLQNAMEVSLECMGIMGISFVPLLSEDGRELVVYVSET